MTTTQENSDKKKNAKNAALLAAPAAIARSFTLQALALFYRTPIKLFRPLRVDYLIMAKAIMPPPSENSTRNLFYRTSIGMISNAVKYHGFSFIPRYILPPFVANSVVGAVLFTFYVSVLSKINGTSSFDAPPPPSPFPAAFFSGAIAGAAQSLVAAPLDSLKVRFEVNDLLDGKHRSMYDYAKKTLKELGFASIYRGIGLTLIKDSLSCGLFFGVFEFAKQQLTDQRHSQKNSYVVNPVFVLAAGGLAAVSYHIIDYPLDKIRNVFLIEEAQSEYQHEKKPRLYRITWEQCKMRARRTGWFKFLYGNFGAAVLRAVPATSIGFLVFELMKRKTDYCI
ncbi:16573_t:CDS:2 [Acaulospora colombiana]|uniref:16573_t:CDS:1 n=1 Tax=Acaulospora colombiana TaxID=27376 RepID=A0ACA9MPY9_9GLOM|nr:16573_t:CDS:2 [Acaulospora colombiana]